MAVCLSKTVHRSKLEHVTKEKKPDTVFSLSLC